MKREDFLRVFAELSPEEQEAIRRELTGEEAAEEPSNPMARCREIMEEMKAGADPMTVCKDKIEDANIERTMLPVMQHFG